MKPPSAAFESGVIERRWVALIALGTVVVFAAFPSLLPERESYCRKLARIVDDQRMSSQLIKWVDNEVPSFLADGDGLRLIAGPDPGRFIIEKDFDWQSIGFNESRGQATLVCGYDSQRIAVYFSEGERSGILVSFDVSFGEYESRIQHRKGRVAVLCRSD